MRPRIDHPVDRLLPDWGAWLRAENRSGLGYSQVQYAEFVARSTSATDWHPRVDPDILRMDAMIRTRLAADSIAILRYRYQYELPDKITAAKLGLSRQVVNQMLHRVVLPQLRLEWDATPVVTIPGLREVS